MSIFQNKLVEVRLKQAFFQPAKQALSAALGNGLAVGPRQQVAQSRGEWRLALPSRAQKCFLASGEQYSNLRGSLVGINNINDLLVGSAIRLTGSLSADSKGHELPFVSS